MNCKNCGAEFSTSEPKCPYCGTENKLVAMKEHSAVMNAYKEYEKKLEKIPDKASRFSIRLVVAAIIGFIVIGICIACVSYFVASAKTKKEYKKYREEMEQTSFLNDSIEIGAYYEM